MKSLSPWGHQWKFLYFKYFQWELLKCLITEATEAHFFPQELSSTYRISTETEFGPQERTQILCVELDSCPKKWASMASVPDKKKTV